MVHALMDPPLTLLERPPYMDVTYRQVHPSEAYGDVVTELQARSSSEVIVVVLDLNQDWDVANAVRWIRDFRQEYQRRLPVYTGQKDYWRADRQAPFKPMPMVRVFKSSITDQEHAELVGAGAGVYDCTPEQLQDHLAGKAANESSASSPSQPQPCDRDQSVEQGPGTAADLKAYNGYPPGVEPGMLGDVLKENLNSSHS